MIQVRIFWNNYRIYNLLNKIIIQYWESHNFAREAYMTNSNWVQITGLPFISLTILARGILCGVIILIQIWSWPLLYMFRFQKLRIIIKKYVWYNIYLIFYGMYPQHHAFPLHPPMRRLLCLYEYFWCGILISFY